MVKKDYEKLKRDYKTNSHGTKQEIYLANVHHLTRIITYLSEVYCAYQKQIRNATGIENAIPSALKFLLFHKIIFIFKKKSNRMIYYKLNPLFK